MGSSGKTRVYLTIDVEGAEERLKGAALQPAMGYDLRVWGRFANQRDDLGIPLIVRELQAVNLAATFFVETLGAPFFGRQGLTEICRFLIGAGQDVQLHVHPVQRRPQWHTRGEPRPSDEIGSYPRDQQTAMLAQAKGELIEAGVPAGSVVAFRAGSFAASNDTWHALAANRLRVDSSFNLCYLQKGCRIQWPTRANALFETGTGVWELPITNFAEGEGRFRHLQVSAVSFAEMRHVLLEARRLGLPEVTIVTHPFEYFVIDDAGEARGRPNTLNIERLRRLCGFLADWQSEFQVETVGALGRRLSTEGLPARPASSPLPRGTFTLRYGRLAAQAYKRIWSSLPS